MRTQSAKGAAPDRRILAAEMLLLGSTQADVSRKLGVTPKTIQGWLRDPSFKQMLATMGNEVHRHRARRLNQLFEKAIRRLEKDIESAENGGVLAMKLIESVGYTELAKASIESAVEMPVEDQQQNEEERIVGVPRLERLDREMRLLAAERDRVAGLVVVEQAPKQQVDEVA